MPSTRKPYPSDVSDDEWSSADLDEITKAEFVPQIPAHTEDDDLPAEMAAFEKVINVLHAVPVSTWSNLLKYEPRLPFAPEPQT